MSASLARIRFRVRGRVQGVGFRWFTQQAARELGLTGWVRNTDSGEVEGEAQGAAHAVDELVARLRAGPGHARVADVVTEPRALDHAAADGFAVHRSR